MDNNKHLPQISALIFEEQCSLTLADLSQACAVNAAWIIELIDAGVLIPLGREPHRWLFTGRHVHHARIALRLQRDLGINPAGIALALQLMDEVDALSARLRINGC